MKVRTLVLFLMGQKSASSKTSTHKLRVTHVKYFCFDLCRHAASFC